MGNVVRIRLLTTDGSLKPAKAFGLANIRQAPSTSSDIPEEKSPIRRQLRRWLLEHEQVFEGMQDDSVSFVKIKNMMTRTQSSAYAGIDHLEDDDEAVAESYEFSDPLDQTTDAHITGAARSTPGDLHEIRSPGSRLAHIAVYLGSFGSRNHFYADNGRWITSVGLSSLFTVSNFASPAELASIMAKIPQDGNPDIFDELRKNEAGPSREDGAALIRKMQEFHAMSDRVYQANLPQLEAAASTLAGAKATRYLSLFEMADKLLPSGLKDADGKFPPAALYSVHMVITQDETNFLPLSPSAYTHRRDQIYEVSSKQEAHIRERIAAIVREHVRAQTDSKMSSKKNDRTFLGQFAQRAKQVVLGSRSQRPLTPHGIIQAPSSYVMAKVDWSEADQQILTFLEWWASYDLFDVSSRFHAYGALILRALDVYPDVPLDQTTAWTFLQEIGSIPPWEIPSRYRVRFPNVEIVSGGGLSRSSPGAIENSLRPDIASGSRKPLDDATVFCIDSPKTEVIDDGISLERTDNPDEFWIHIHTADPASGIQPNSSLCRFMELVPENIYLPGHFQAMLPSELGEDDGNDYESQSLVKRYSLQPQSSALTFSAKVNLRGDMLDYKIEPSTISNVKYLDPENVAQFCAEPQPPPSPAQALTVGSPPKEYTDIPNRPMVAAEDLDKSSRDDLLQLYQLTSAVKQRRLAKGAWPYFAPRPSVTVAFEKPAVDEQQQQPPSDILVLPSEPYIKVDYPSSSGSASVVSDSMVLAGEIAARWCSDRGIPIPYRKDVGDNKSRAAAFEYASNVLYPLIHEGKEPTASQRGHFINLLGGNGVASTPGPYFLLGLDMYAKATSPLRRFSDLLAHWQIHAALEHERKTGRALDPSVDQLEKILPFTGERFETALSFLHLRERMARVVSRGRYEWILMALLRAWKFEQTAPRTFSFRVTNRWGDGVSGTLDLFDLEAFLSTQGLDGKVLKKDIRIGDQFEVELMDINIRARTIRVKALRHLGDGARGTLPRHAELKEPGLSSAPVDAQKHTTEPLLA